MPLVAISDAQREPIAKANFVATVHHGIPVHLLEPTYDRGRGRRSGNARRSSRGWTRTLKKA
jgi:hypothetical protein